MTPIHFLKKETTCSLVLALLYFKISPEAKEEPELDPAFIVQDIEDRYNVELSEHQIDKLMAGISILTSDSYETNLRAFEVINRLLINQPASQEVFYPTEAEDLAVALAQVYIAQNVLDSSIENDDLDFSPEVRRYAGQIFYEFGLTEAPEIFPMAIMPDNTVKAEENADDEKNEVLTDFFKAGAQFVNAQLKDAFPGHF